jgi:serine/threonine-protein kinase
VVETLDAGLLPDGSAYVLMELLEGSSLHEVLEAEGRLEPARLLELMAQVTAGLSVAHAAGIVHRDLKPENIFLSRGPSGEEEVKILDFGISQFARTPTDELGPPSRLTREGTVLGTPYYMSPEQACAAAVDERTDIYALGVMMYEALSGRLPFLAHTTSELFAKIGAGEYLPLRHVCQGIDPGLAKVVERALHRDPEQRFPSVDALAAALAEVAGEGSGSEAASAETANIGAPKRLSSRHAEGRPGTVVTARRWWRLAVPAAVLGALGLAWLTFAPAEHASDPALQGPAAAPSDRVDPPEASRPATKQAMPARSPGETDGGAWAKRGAQGKAAPHASTRAPAKTAAAPAPDRGSQSGEPDARAPSRRGPRTPAERAGLEGNPYSR